MLPGTPDTFYQDQANPDAFPAYQHLLRETCIPDLITDLFGGRDLWLMYEQIGWKDSDTRRTQWHQDSPTCPVAGRDLAVQWNLPRGGSA